MIKQIITTVIVAFSSFAFSLAAQVTSSSPTCVRLAGPETQSTSKSSSFLSQSATLDSSPKVHHSLSLTMDTVSTSRDKGHLTEQCAPVGSPAPNFEIYYEAYIPTDHVTGGPSSACLKKGDTTAIYLGDVPHGSAAGYHTNRMWVFFDLYTKQPSSSQFSTYSTGETFQFYSPSPVNGSYLSSADYVPASQLGMCSKENAHGQAQIPANGSLAVSYTSPSSTSVKAAVVGTIANPLQYNIVSIGWNFSIQATASAEQAYGLVYVSGKVTCYPEHIITASGQIIAQYVPSSNSPMYIGPCLVGPDSFSLTGVGTVGSGAKVPVNQGSGVS